MKKIILMLIAVFGIVSILPNVFAYDIPYSGIVSGSWIDFDSDTEIIGGVDYTWVTLETGMIGPEVITFYSLNDLMDASIYLSDFTAIEYVSTNNGINKIGIHSNTLGDLNTYHGYNTYFRVYMKNSLLTMPAYDVALAFVNKYFKQFNGNINQFINAIDQSSYSNGYNSGYDTAKGEYGYYNGTNWITATVHGSNRYNAGLNENRAYYGILYDDTWLTAEQYGVIRYGIGYETGLSTEIDWFDWSMTFFLMPFRIMNIEVLPGIRIGYFALFSLLLGVVGWFFFIVGKGGGRKK